MSTASRTRVGSALVCAGCGASPAADEPYPFRCPNFGQGDVDHVLVRKLDPSLVTWPDADDPNPFIAYRSLFHSYHVAADGGMDDAEYSRVVDRLDEAVAEVDGQGFRVTPFALSEELSARLGFEEPGGVWVKDETHNVSGSHKARHLMGVALQLAVADELGLTGDRTPTLAIASCGNAALAAAVVARAASRPIDVFVPADAPASVIERLHALAANVVVCERRPGVAGDPTFHRLREAIDAGALPFTCQGSENGLVVEGGETLGWEIVSSGTAIDRIVVQVGGGALASAVIQSMNDAVLLGALPAPPRVDTVQTESAHPLRRAYQLVAARVAAGEPRDVALRYAAAHRSEFMWPWESPPHSVAHGILDDETYDWHAVVAGMLQTGGTPLVVGEEILEEANSLGREATGIDADHTGTSGLAGLLQLVRSGAVDPRERVAVLFTGVRR